MCLCLSVQQRNSCDKCAHTKTTSIRWGRNEKAITWTHKKLKCCTSEHCYFFLFFLFSIYLLLFWSTSEHLLSRQVTDGLNCKYECVRIRHSHRWIYTYEHRSIKYRHERIVYYNMWTIYRCIAFWLCVHENDQRSCFVCTTTNILPTTVNILTKKSKSETIVYSMYVVQSSRDTISTTINRYDHPKWDVCRRNCVQDNSMW